MVYWWSLKGNNFPLETRQSLDVLLVVLMIVDGYFQSPESGIIFEVCFYLIDLLTKQTRI